MQRSLPGKKDPESVSLKLLLLLVALLFLFSVTVLGMLFIPGQQELDDSRILAAAVSIAVAVILIVSAMSIIRRKLLVPLQQIRHWARQVQRGLPATRLAWSEDREPDDLEQNLNAISSRVPSLLREYQPQPANVDELDRIALKTLYDVVASINSTHSLDDLLTRFMFTFKRITGAEGAAIWVEHDHQAPELGASSGISEGLLMPGRHEIRRCLCERAATEGRIWIEETLEKCEKIAGQRFFASDDFGLVAIPIRYRGKVSGVINLFLTRDRIPGIENIKTLLNSMSHHLAIAIEQYRAQEENRAHLIKEERTRIAHELHDSLAQSMASLRFQVRVLDETMHQGDESTTWQQLERIENSLDEANTELRALIANFRAPAYHRGLVESIEQMVSQFRTETRIRTYLQKDCTSSTFARDTELQILRIIQEALWNIRKHSQAKTVRILLRHSREHGCHILIEDDGIGINEQVYGSAGEHVGLTIMQERASKIGGTLRVESEPGEGTRVLLDIRNTGTGNTH